MPDEGGDLVADALAPARRHENQGITTADHLRHGLRLQAAKGWEAEHAAQDFGRAVAGFDGHDAIRHRSCADVDLDPAAFHTRLAICRRSHRVPLDARGRDAVLLKQVCDSVGSPLG